MKNFHYVALTAALLLAPAFVLAGDILPPGSTAPNAPLKDKRLLPPPGQIIKTIRETASSTRADIKDLKVGAKDFAKEQKENIRARLASSTPEERQQMRLDSRTQIEQKRAEVKTQVEAVKQKAKEKFSEAVQTSVNNIIDRLTNNVGSLTKITARIDSRISELQIKGTNMDASVALLMGARADITAAQDKIAAVGTALSATLASATPKTEMPKVRDAVKSAEDAIRTAKDSLKATLDSVKAATINQ